MQSLWMRFGHPIGKRNYGLSGIHPADLSALTLEALVQRTGIDPALVDDVIPGAARPGRRADIRHWPRRRALGRLAGAHPRCHFRPAVRLVPAGREFAAASVIAGHYDLVVAGCVEPMSRVPMGSNRMNAWLFAEGFRSHGDAAPDLGVGAEMVVEPCGFSRAQLDEFSLQSHA
jgi:acetyl-CoA acyltransferase